MSERTVAAVGPLSVKPKPPPLFMPTPAMSRCTHGMRGASASSDVRPTKRCRKRPANREPPAGSPIFAFWRSAMGESSSSFMCTGRGSCQASSPTCGRGRKVVGDRVVIAHDARVTRSEGDRDGAGEGRDVDDDIRMLAARRDQAVGQDEAALGIRVENLDGRAVEHPEHVAGARRATRGHVVGDAEPRRDVDGQLRASRPRAVPRARSPRRTCRTSCRPSRRPA